jgi:hypothetical protein
VVLKGCHLFLFGSAHPTDHLSASEQWHVHCQGGANQHDLFDMETETTTAQKGKINVSTENIFPIIKKFLYSDHEIFLRELVANATDATQKLKTLSGLGEATDELGDLTIELILDEKAGTLTIKDRGVGMTAEEVNKYINDIAFSGAEEFVNKYKDKAEAIIGHFGLGFYSSFMVAKQVEIITKSHVPGTVAAHWTCDGSPNYTLDAHDRTERGTDIILHIADDSKEFLEKARIQGILDKYCKFLPVTIKFGTKTRTQYAERDEDGNKKGEDTEVVEDNIVNNPESCLDEEPNGADHRAVQRLLPRALPYELGRASVPHPPQRGLSVQSYGHSLLPQDKGQHLGAEGQDPALQQSGVRHRFGRGHRA